MRISLITPVDTAVSDGGLDGIIRSLPFGADERKRLTAIKNTSALCDSVSARLALMRLCPDGGDIARDESGKPFFERHASPSFSLSHTRGICAAAVAERGEGLIGLDIEAVDTSRDFCRIAERFFTDSELERFRKNGETADAFLSVWTEKEARAKLFGTGLSHELSDACEKKKIYLYKYKISIGAVQAILCAASERKAKNINFIDCEEFLIDGIQDRA